jgi:hypothetical protein
VLLCVQGRLTTCNLAAEGAVHRGGGMGGYGQTGAYAQQGYGLQAGAGMRGMTPAAMGMMAAQGFAGAYSGYASGAMGYGDPNYGSSYGGPGAI